MAIRNQVLTSTLSNLITGGENNHNQAITSFFTWQSVMEKTLSFNFFSEANKIEIFPFSGSTDDQKETDNRENALSKMALEKFYSQFLTNYTLNLSFHSKPLQS